LSPSDASLVLDITTVSVPQCDVSVPIRKSSRVRHKSSYLHHYHCQMVDSSSSSPVQSSSFVADQSSSGTTHALSSVLSYDHLSHSDKHFALSISTAIEPQFFHQAVKKHSCWHEAMQSEIDA